MKQHYPFRSSLLAMGLVLGLLLGTTLPGTAQNISTVAGDGTTSVTGSGTGATTGVALDSDGNVYVATSATHVIRKMTPDGTYSTIAGTGTAGYSGDGGLATAATLNTPSDVYVSGNALYIADANNRRIRRVDLSSNVITTVAGDGTTGTTGSGIGYAVGVAVDASGTIYVAAGSSHVVRQVSASGTYSTIAGTGTAGYSGDGGAATAAALNLPSDVYVTSSALYIADTNNRRIRKLDLSAGTISTVAGDGTAVITGTGIGYTQGVAADASGNVFVAAGTSAASSTQVIRKMTPDGTYSTIAGTGTAGYSGDGGLATAATLSAPSDVFLYGRDLYIADVGNRRVRKVTNVTTGPSATPLPVVLVSFTAECQATAGLLRWTTASELNSSYFAVESSLDGTTFQTLAQLAATGTSTQLHTYQYQDAHLARYGAGTRVCYRLRQVDTDGVSTYSPVRTLLAPAWPPLALQGYPNPAHGTAVSLRLATSSSAPLTLTVTNTLGQVVLRRQATASSQGTLLLPEAASWLPGSYLIRVGQGSQQQLFRLTCD